MSIHDHDHDRVGSKLSIGSNYGAGDVVKTDDVLSFGAGGVEVLLAMLLVCQDPLQCSHGLGGVADGCHEEINSNYML